jgi:hypothetical protein
MAFSMLASRDIQRLLNSTLVEIDSRSKGEFRDHGAGLTSSALEEEGLVP